jgi:transcriptional regulator with PAS, ATPase and Fis domain
MNWTDGFLGAITVCDREGIVVYMNDRSKLQFSKDGGESLIGKSLVDCHPEPSRSLLLKIHLSS